MNTKTYFRTCKLIVFLCAVLLLLTIGLTYSTDFLPFDFEASAGIQDDDVDGKLKLLTGSEAGAEVLREASSVALVKLGKPQNIAPVFSFNFNRAPVTHFCLTARELTDNLLKQMKDTANYGKGLDHRYVMDKWVTGFALEISTGSNFMRVCFDKDITYCNFTTSDGKTGGSCGLWMVSGRIKDAVQEAFKAPKGKWMDVTQVMKFRDKVQDTTGDNPSKR